MSVKEKLALLKEERINEILNDNNLSKIEKLEIIETEKLWGYASFIQHEFVQWEKEAIELEKIEAERILEEGSSDSNEICAKQFYQSRMTDSIFDPSTFLYERCEQVSYADHLSRILEFHENEGDNPLITVISTRHPCIELKKPFKEIVDAVFEFACNNKIIGFTNDW